MKRSGFSIVELLITVTVVGILAGIGFISGRTILQGQEERAAVHSFRQAVSRGSSAASSRGKDLQLIKSDNNLILKELSSSKVFQKYPLAKTVGTNLSNGALLDFQPTGKITESSLNALPNPIKFTTDTKTYQLTVSLIGEVKVVIQ